MYHHNVVLLLTAHHWEVAIAVFIIITVRLRACRCHVHLMC